MSQEVENRVGRDLALVEPLEIFVSVAVQASLPPLVVGAEVVTRTWSSGLVIENPPPRTFLPASQTAVLVTEVLTVADGPLTFVVVPRT